MGEIAEDRMWSVLGLGGIEATLRTKIKLYKKRAWEIEDYLSKRPEEWGRFQNEFNSEINSFFRDIMNFEKVNLSNGHEDKVYKLKSLFVDRIRKIFMRGVYIKWSLSKPFGYAGDFKDEIERLGGEGFISKPVSLGKLNEIIEGR